MLKFLKSYKRSLLFGLFVLSLVPFLLKMWTPEKPHRSKNERYSEDLKAISSLDQLALYSEAIYKKSNPSSVFDTSKYVWELSETIKNRFYHKDLKYSFSENWIAWLVGKTIWSHVSFIVLSDDILKHSEAICSQQTSVFMEVLRNKGISVRSVGLGFDEGPGHYLCEVKYNGGWHLYDVSMEPAWENVEESHMSLDYYLAKKEILYKAYQKRLTRPLFDKILERHSFGVVNKLPAKNMKLLHQTMHLCTYLLPIFLGFLLIFFREKNAPEIKTVESFGEKKKDLILIK